MIYSRHSHVDDSEIFRIRGELAFKILLVLLVFEVTGLILLFLKYGQQWFEAHEGYHLKEIVIAVGILAIFGVYALLLSWLKFNATNRSTRLKEYSWPALLPIGILAAIYVVVMFGTAMSVIDKGWPVIWVVRLFGLFTLLSLFLGLRYVLKGLAPRSKPLSLVRLFTKPKRKPTTMRLF